MKSLIRNVAESPSNPRDFVSDEPPTNWEIEPDLTVEPRNSS